jgi:hypothetical protein
MSDDLAKGEGGSGKREGRGGVWPTRKRKAPQGEPYGARWGMGRLGDSREGDRGHGRYAKGTKEKPTQGTE